MERGEESKKRVSTWLVKLVPKVKASYISLLEGGGEEIEFEAVAEESVTEHSFLEPEKIVMLFDARCLV